VISVFRSIFSLLLSNRLLLLANGLFNSLLGLSGIFVRPVQPFVAVPSNQYSSKELYLAAHQQIDERPNLSSKQDDIEP